MAGSKVCLARKILDDEDFIELPYETQMAYIYLNLNASCKGVIDGARRILKSYDIDAKILQDLVDNGYLIPVDKSHVIKHWWLNNNKDNINYQDTSHIKILAQVEEQEDRTYKLKVSDENDSSEVQTETSLDSDCEQSLIEREKNVTRTTKEKKNENKGKEKMNGSKTPLSTAPCPVCKTTGVVKEEKGRYFVDCPKCRRSYEINENGYPT